MNYKGQWESEDTTPDYPRVLVLLVPDENGNLRGLLILDGPGSQLLGTADDVSIYFDFKGLRHVGVFSGRPAGETIEGRLDVGKGADSKSYNITLRRKREPEEKK